MLVGRRIISSRTSIDNENNRDFIDRSQVSTPTCKETFYIHISLCILKHFNEFKYGFKLMLSDHVIIDYKIYFY